jgi:hypothetical protein
MHAAAWQETITRMTTLQIARKAMEKNRSQTKQSAANG